MRILARARVTFIEMCVVLAIGMSGIAPASVYVVDQAVPGAADTNPGNEEKPFRTVQAAANVVQPGDTVYVMQGSYGEQVKVRGGGVQGKPIAFVARPRRTATVRGFDLEASHVRIEGFEITADEPATAVQLRASHCEILDCYIHHMRTAVSGTAGKLSSDGKTRDYSSVTHNRIAYNEVYHCEFGFMLGGEDWLVENNEVSRLYMYASGKRNDDCDYSRFFGKRCVQRYNYYHGSTKEEIRTAHVDCLQTFCNNGEIAMDLVFEHNTCFDFHQLCMVESTPHIGNVRNWTLRYNVISASGPLKGGWGPNLIQTPNVTIENCTISGVAWATIGLRGKESSDGLIRNNILCEAQRALIHGDEHFSPANPRAEYNLTFNTTPLEGEKNSREDPLFANSAERNFRLRKNSPAIGAGKAGVTLGALEYPNVYYVDPRHPAAADEPGWGYPGVPLATLAKACSLAEPGETIVLREGVYREVLAPKPGVKVRAMSGEKVTISGADLIERWKHDAEGGWSAALEREPKRVLRDGKPWPHYSYSPATKQISVQSGGDPRLHVFETITREHGIILQGKEEPWIEHTAVENTLKAGIKTP